jgi:ribosome-associated protein
MLTLPYLSVLIKEIMQLPFPEIEREFLIKTSRSGGKGGQNVNKVSTKVEIHFDIAGSSAIPEEAKEKLLEKLKNKLTLEGKLIVVSQAARSQLENKEIAKKKLHKILENALKEKKPRKATKPSKAAKEKRLKEKKMASEIKKLRGKI